MPFHFDQLVSPVVISVISFLWVRLNITNRIFEKIVDWVTRWLLNAAFAKWRNLNVPVRVKGVIGAGVSRVLSAPSVEKGLDWAVETVPPLGADIEATLSTDNAHRNLQRLGWYKPIAKYTLSLVSLFLVCELALAFIVPQAVQAFKLVHTPSQPQPTNSATNIPPHLTTTPTAAPSFTIQANQGWQQTVVVHQGQHVQITASGSWNAWPGGLPSSGPAGAGECCGQYLQASSQLLIGKFATHANENTPVFAVATSWQGDAPMDGWLYLRINDSDHGLADNSGSMVVAPLVAP